MREEVKRRKKRRYEKQKKRHPSIIAINRERIKYDRMKSEIHKLGPPQQ